MKRIDLSGQRFGRYVVQDNYKKIGRRLYWECLCDCGTNKFVLASNLTDKSTSSSSSSKSCGCLRNEMLHERLFNPNAKVRNPLYSVWQQVKHNACERWASDFNLFLEDVKERVEDRYFVRINKNEVFSPTNFAWVEKLEHNKNKRTNLMFNINGTMLNQTDACKALGLTLYYFKKKKYVQEDT